MRKINDVEHASVSKETDRALARLRLPAALVAGAVLLTACASLDQAELRQIGNRIDRASIDFRVLSAYGQRSWAAYRTEAEIRRRYPMTVRVASPAGTGVQYFLEQDRVARAQYLTVRGSIDSLNFAEDLQFALANDGRIDIPVHRGFDRTARAIYADVKPYLAPGYRTHLTGHSLGAAVSAIVMLYMVADGVEVSRMVGFGQPRFTTAKGLDAFRRLPITRVVDENDVVPMLPPSTVLDPLHGFYEQVGPEIILLDGRKYVYLDAHDASRISIGEFWRSAAIANIKDHSIDRYLKRMASKLDSAEAVSYARRNLVEARN